MRSSHASPTAHETAAFLLAEEPIPHSDFVRRIASNVMFEYSLDGGTSWVFFGMGKPSTWWIVPDARGAMPSQHLSPSDPDFRYNLSLSKTLDYASGGKNWNIVLRRVTTGIDREIGYDPGEVVPGHVLNAFAHGWALCSLNAALLHHLGAAAGIPLSVVYTWGGSSAASVDYYSVGPYVASFQVQAPVHDRAGANPHFTYHAIVNSLGTYYDPSHGSSSSELPQVLEVCAPYSIVRGICQCNPTNPAFIPRQQTGAAFPPATELLLPCAGAAPPP